MPIKTNGTLGFLRNNWFLIVAVSSFIGMIATLNYRVSYTEDMVVMFMKDFGEYKLEIRDIKKDIEHLTDIMKRNEAALNETKLLIKEIR